jgi:hypothetical protein
MQMMKLMQSDGIMLSWGWDPPVGISAVEARETPAFAL